MEAPDAWAAADASDLCLSEYGLDAVKAKHWAILADEGRPILAMPAESDSECTELPRISLIRMLGLCLPKIPFSGFHQCNIVKRFPDIVLVELPAISQSHLQRQFNELILVRVAAFGEGLEDLREKKGL